MERKYIFMYFRLMSGLRIMSAFPPDAAFKVAMPLRHARCIDDPDGTRHRYGPVLVLRDVMVAQISEMPQRRPREPRAVRLLLIIAWREPCPRFAFVPVRQSATDHRSAPAFWIS